MTVEYNSIGPYSNHGVTMAGALKNIGITPDNVDYMKLVGDEITQNIGFTLKVKLSVGFWDRYFETAEPYKYWRPSGARRFEIYVKGNPNPKTTILTNETDSCSAEDDPKKLTYMCYGLHEWYMNNLTTK